MKLYKHAKQKLKYWWWMFIYSNKLGVPGLRIKYDFYNGTPIIIPYNYLLKFIAQQLALTRIDYGNDNLLLKTSTHWETIKNNINISPISKELLTHLFYKLQFNKEYILDHIKYDQYYKNLYNKKIIELNSI